MIDAITVFVEKHHLISLGTQTEAETTGRIPCLRLRETYHGIWNYFRTFGNHVLFCHTFVVLQDKSAHIHFCHTGIVNFDKVETSVQRCTHHLVNQEAHGTFSRLFFPSFVGRGSIGPSLRTSRHCIPFATTIDSTRISLSVLQWWHHDVIYLLV